MNLSELLLKKGILKKDMANELDIKPANIRRYEDLSKVKLDMLKKIAKYVGEDVSYLISSDNQHSPIGVNDQYLPSSIKSESPMFPDLIRAINNISESILKNADNDRVRAEAELERAKAEVINRLNMQRMLDMIPNKGDSEQHASPKKGVHQVEGMDKRRSA